jgi:hypothetical protein
MTNRSLKAKKMYATISSFRNVLLGYSGGDISFSSVDEHDFEKTIENDYFVVDVSASDRAYKFELTIALSWSSNGSFVESVCVSFMPMMCGQGRRFDLLLGTVESSYHVGDSICYSPESLLDFLIFKFDEEFKHSLSICQYYIESFYSVDHNLPFNAPFDASKVDTKSAEFSRFLAFFGLSSEDFLGHLESFDNYYSGVDSSLEF